jgi:hypothetical protein
MTASTTMPEHIMPEHTETVRLRLAPDDRHPLADLLEAKGFDYLAEQLRVTRRPVSWSRCTIVTPQRRNDPAREREVWAARCPVGYSTGEIVEIRSRKGEITRVVLGDVIKQDPRGYTLRRCRKVRE